MLYSSCSSWISHFLACVGNCFGYCINIQTIVAGSAAYKGLQNHDPAWNRPSISDDFWSTSTYDLENSTTQFQRSLSSIIVSNQNLDQLNAVSSSSNSPEFVNHGLLLWNQSRLLWVGTEKSKSHGKVRGTLSWNETCEAMLGTSKRLPQPIPLSEMVELLVDGWEQEGLYD